VLLISSLLLFFFSAKRSKNYSSRSKLFNSLYPVSTFSFPWPFARSWENTKYLLYFFIFFIFLTSLKVRNIYVTEEGYVKLKDNDSLLLEEEIITYAHFSAPEVHKGREEMR
jgi:hypothetical protein